MIKSEKAKKIKRSYKDEQKKEKRNLKSKDRRAPTRVVAASTPPFRWQGHWQKILNGRYLIYSDGKDSGRCLIYSDGKDTSRKFEITGQQ